jgi:hypothetical protein
MNGECAHGYVSECPECEAMGQAYLRAERNERILWFLGGAYAFALFQAIHGLLSR